MERPPGNILITGVTGCLGGHLAARLHREGITVRGLGRDGVKGKILTEKLGMDFVPFDLGSGGPSADRLHEAFAGIGTVFHAAALSSPWGRLHDFETANVEGTRQVLQAARHAGVGRVVHVSTPSLYFRHGGGTLVREDAALPDPPVNHYVRTKRRAETLVREAAEGGLEMVILRPRALIGPGDPSILPRLVLALQKGRLPVIGDGHNLTDLTCITNVAEALLLAARAPAELVSGNIYNITNGEPALLWNLLRQLAARLGLPQPRRRISRRAAMVLAGVLETVGKVSGQEPLLTQYGVGVLSCTQTLDITAARRDLGYQPADTVEQGLEAFCQWWEKGRAYPFF